MKRMTAQIVFAALITVAAVSMASANSVILQYYESRWETIEKKMPDVFMAGYTHFWLPPPYKADTGNFSVGYDVYDRFNLGSAFDQTLYGTESSLKSLIRLAQRSGALVYLDYVPNHNGFRDLGTPGFHAAGGYPGFVLTLPGDIDGDFHGRFASGELDGRLAGLIDIAQEKNHVFIRHPTVPGPQNIPNQTPNPLNARFYPDQSLPANFLGIRPFNLANPMAGDPTPENATGLLLRNAQYLIEVIGADGLRIDAVKHVPDWFFRDFFDNVMYQRGRKDLAGNPTTPFSFGEAYDGSFAVLSRYTRKDGFGNRDVKDFPLFFTVRDVLNANGFGDMRRLEFCSFDGSDGNFNDGTRGVGFVQSHDNGGPALLNVAYAYLLTRPGFPIVYFNAKEFGTGRDFPQDGRGDALGGDFGNIIPTLVSISRRYAKGPFFTRAIDDNVFVYERSNSLLVGINDRMDSGYDQRTVVTNFRNITLTELTGAATDPVVNANGDFPQTITIGNDGIATIRVPRNRTNTVTHGRGYIMYGMAPPQQTLTVSPVTSVLAAETTAVPNGIRRHTPMQVITGTTIGITVQTAPSPQEDNALVRLDAGVDINTTPGLFLTTGEFAGFENFNVASPRASGGSGFYSLTTSTVGLAEGPHFIETVAFHPRLPNEPAVYSSARAVIYLDRLPPPVQMVFPTNTGTSDVLSKSYQVVMRCPDGTADSMHIFFDQPNAYDFYGNISPANKMTRVDRDEFRFDWNNITSGLHKISVVVFEPTGNTQVVHFNNIAAVVPEPDMALGVDTNPSPSAVNFQPVPGTIADRAYPNEFVVRVKTQVASGTLSFPADFTVSLEVDGITYNAQPYNPALLPPVNRLVQNDQNLSDDFDEFRFLWRGYGRGVRSFVARAALTNNSQPPNSVSALVTVPDSVPGPVVVIQSPTPGTTFDQPTSLTVRVAADATVGSIQAYIGVQNQQILLGQINNAVGLTPYDITTTVSNYLASDSLGGLNLDNGNYTIRAVAATGQNGTGITNEALTSITVTGFPAPPPPPALPAVDGNLSEFFSLTPLAVSAADGGSGSGNPQDFGADGSLTELHGRVGHDGNLYLAVRGDIFNGTNQNQNATIIYIDTDGTQSTGATSMATSAPAPPPTLGDTSSQLRKLARQSSFYLSPALVTAGVGFDAAVVFDGRNPVVYGIFGFGTGGVPGSPSNFAEIQGTFAFGTGLGAYPGATGTTIAGPTGFEVSIPLAALGNPDPRKMRFAVVTTSDTFFPSPNTLPENAQNTFDAVQMLDGVAQFPAPPAVRLNEIANGAPDWVEIVNASASPQNLGNWRLRWTDGAGASAILPLTGLNIPAGAYLLVADGALTPPAPPGSIQTTSNIPWANDRAGSAALIDAYGVAVDYVRWESDTVQQSPDGPPPGTAFTGWAQGFNSAGSPPLALTRDEFSTDTDQASDWYRRTPTPGAPLSADVMMWEIY
ncbi:MAG: lamin tail domain-containing protein [Candidatus Sumerlaeaceae bacterium]|nr:lamin tail domain-containing protein [Candidatus Sumerlaeaceae bacterium]